MDEGVTIVTGSKGGVGTSTVALNLAVQLAMQTKKRVALIDLARPFGQISLMLDFEPRFTVLDALERIERLDESILMSMATRHKAGVDILAGPLQAPMKAEQRQCVTIQSIARLIQLAGRGYDFVVVDIGVVNAGDWALVLAGGANHSACVGAKRAGARNDRPSHGGSGAGWGRLREDSGGHQQVAAE